MQNYNYRKLLGRIREKGITQEELARQMGKNTATISRKLNNLGFFTQAEISDMCNILQISSSDIPTYFFAH